MKVAYLDASAAMKLVIEERESASLAAELDRDESRMIVSSWLLHTELHCAAGRRPEAVGNAEITAVLDRVILIDITRGDLLAAGTHAPLRSNDAIHFATALRVGASELITYDNELIAAATHAGLRALAPS